LNHTGVKISQFLLHVQACARERERDTGRGKRQRERTCMQTCLDAKQERETETEMYCRTFTFATESPFEGIVILLHKSFFAHLF
jgi:hypothetical protein